MEELPLASSTMAPVRAPALVTVVKHLKANDEIVSLNKGKQNLAAPKTSDKVVKNKYKASPNELLKLLNEGTFVNTFTNFSEYKLPQSSDPNTPPYYSLPPHIITYVFFPFCKE